jgi:hypothetical protein
MKGFEIKKEPTGEAQEGDECSMTDGTIGTFSKQDGKLVCVPSDAKSIKTTPETGGDKDPSESSMWEDLKTEHAFHEKAVKSHVSEYVKGAQLEAEKKPEDGDDEAATEEKRLKSLEMHKKKLKAVMKAENERHIKTMDDCIKAYDNKPSDDDSDDQSGQGGDDDNDADNRKSISHAIDELKTLLAAYQPNEGDEAPEGDPKKRSTPAVAADLLPEEVVTLARELNTATRDALTRFNHEKSRKG